MRAVLGYIPTLDGLSSDGLRARGTQSDSCLELSMDIKGAICGHRDASGDFVLGPGGGVSIDLLPYRVGVCRGFGIQKTSMATVALEA